MDAGNGTSRRYRPPGESPGYVGAVVACVVAATAAFIVGRASGTATEHAAARPAAVAATPKSSARAAETSSGRAPSSDRAAETPVRRTPSNDVDDDFLSPIVVDEKTNSIDVLLVVDRDDKDHAAVDAAVMRAVDAASAELDRQFGVKLHVTETQTLRFGEEPWDADAAINKLISRYTPPKGQLVLAFGPRPQTGMTTKAPDWGVARYYGSHAMVFLEPGDAEWEHAGHVILHEIGHVFGGWHSPDPASVMCVGADRRLTTDFDSVSAGIVRIGLASARRSTRTSSADAFDRLARMCADLPSPPPGEWAPAIEMLRRRAADARWFGRINSARRLMQRAMELAKIPGICTPEQAKELEEGR